MSFKKFYLVGGILLSVLIVAAALTILSSKEFIHQFISNIATAWKMIVSVSAGITAISVAIYGYKRNMYSKQDKNEHADILGKLDEGFSTLNQLNTNVQVINEEMAKVTDRLNAMESSITTLDTNATFLGNSMQSILKRVQVFEGKDEATLDAHKKLDTVGSDFIDMLDSRVKEFAKYKVDRFSDLVVDIIKIGFYKKTVIAAKGPTINSAEIDKVVTAESFKKMVIDRAEEIKLRGYEMLGKEFIDEYYKFHNEDTLQYVADTLDIITSPDNFKSKRFLYASLDFMKIFLKKLKEVYATHKDKLS